MGYLLGRAGIDVIVLEKHADFFRDFRGDTIHPSTIQILHELGLLGNFLKVPHQEVKELYIYFNKISFKFADFTHLPVPHPSLVLMPQWDFLNFMAKKAEQYSSFKLIRNAKVTELVKNDNRITSIVADTPEGKLQVNANLIIGADGRSSDVRRLAALSIVETGAPIDVLWFRLSRKKEDPPQTLGRFQQGQLMVMLDRDDYWQCAYVIAKGGYNEIRQRPLENFREKLIQVTPFLKDRVQELKTWDDIKLLSVTIDHLEHWYTSGLLCIGDAAHAMSPIGGVGINLALQDAVAAANILYTYLQQGNPVPDVALKKVQRRREFPARIIQRGQVLIQNGLMKKQNDKRTDAPLPLPFKLISKFPILQRLPARIVGMGFRPEHVSDAITNH